MKAIVWTGYGSADVLRLSEIAKPTPRDNEVLIRVHATTVTMGDCELRSFNVPDFVWLPMRLWLGVLKPRKNVLGQELAGVVEAVGSSVKRFKVGDQIFADTGMRLGAHAEYACLPEEGNSENGTIVHKPTNMSYEEAAAVPVGGLTAMRFIKEVNLQRGEKILINGAGGSIGTWAVQLAKLYGAHVTAVDSTAKLDMLRDIGADEVIDYTREDFTQQGVTYDVIFDIVGKGSFSRCLKALAPDGRYLMANPKFIDLVRGFWATRTSRKKVFIGMSSSSREDLIYLKERIEAGELKAVIDRRYRLEHIPDAHRYVEKGLKMGHVIISLASN